MFQGRTLIEEKCICVTTLCSIFYEGINVGNEFMALIRIHLRDWKKIVECYPDNVSLPIYFYAHIFV